MVLVAQDTTAFNDSSHPATAGLGPTGNRHGYGLFGHAALALTPDGEPLGLLHRDLWAQEPEAVGRTQTRRQRNTQEKESQKWADGLTGVEKRLPSAPEVLLIQDREGDVFALLATPRRPGLHLLLRAAQARKVRVPAVEGTPETEGALFAAAAAAPVVGKLTVPLPAKAGREEREALLVVRAVALAVPPPRHGKGGEPKTPQRVWVVPARAEDPPASLPAAEAIEWVLVSTRPVATLAAAVARVR